MVNVSEGSRTSVIAELASAARPALLDVHSDPHHNRSVFTLVGPDVENAARRLAASAIENIDMNDHCGVHPCIGAVDVVPFVPWPASVMTMTDAIEARDEFANWIASEMGIPCFLYGAMRSLPAVRKQAFEHIQPDLGPADPHPTAGACAVGAREILVAYNLWISGISLSQAKSLATSLRRPGLRVLALDVGGRVQISCNLTEPLAVGPAEVYDEVAQHVSVDGVELVGLLPRSVLMQIPASRHDELGLADGTTVEARLASTRGLQQGEDLAT